MGEVKDRVELLADPDPPRRRERVAPGDEEFDLLDDHDRFHREQRRRHASAAAQQVRGRNHQERVQAVVDRMVAELTAQETDLLEEMIAGVLEET